ncbi:HNH endonuclease [Tersicoccus phoenicis]|uniref:HNH endonuclease n=1 Tax=Tersicoccus phoenicis TaxID=554083 RepID=UPI001F40716F|nr:HNH endonuclease signature motif containing protein [Tersicoccus phoenicis]
MIDRIRALEELKTAASAAQVRATVQFEVVQRAAQAAVGVPAGQRGAGVGAQVALARRESPARGGRYLGLAHLLVADLPHTLAAMSAGTLSEWRATLIARETVYLGEAADRRAVDAALSADTGGVDGLGDQALVAAARRISYRIDPAAVTARARRAEGDRHVTCRPAPDTMTYLTGLLPVADGVAVYAALSREADTLTSRGDGRGRGQIMADTLTARVTGHPPVTARRAQAGMEPNEEPNGQAPEQATGGQAGKHAPGGQATGQATGGQVRIGQPRRTLPGPSWPGPAGGETPRGGPPRDGAPSEDAHGEARPNDRRAAKRARVELQVVITDRALLAGGGEPAYLAGYGMVPAPWARELVDGRTDVFVRRLFLAPDTGQLVGMDSRARLMPEGLRRFIQVRDRTCRTPWCDAPIRHVDHVHAHAAGGATSEVNGQGLCERCNHAKEAPGWAAVPVEGPRHTVVTTTPTGHTYTSTAPPIPGTGIVSPAGTAGTVRTVERAGTIDPPGTVSAAGLAQAAQAADAADPDDAAGSEPVTVLSAS